MSNKQQGASSYATIDKQFEENCLNYLLKSKIAKELNVTETITNADIQKKGVDWVGMVDKDKVNIDVKSIAQYDFETFCFELLNSKSGRIGWLINSELDTDYFLLTYHDVKGGTGSYKDDKKILTPSNITKTKALLINKDKLIGRIQKELQNLDLRIACFEVLTKGSKSSKPVPVFSYENGEFVEKYGGDVRFVYSKYNMYEKPINIVISRKILEDVADRTWDIEETGRLS